jgi:hypothetical protein
VAEMGQLRCVCYVTAVLPPHMPLAVDSETR